MLRFTPALYSDPTNLFRRKMTLILLRHFLVTTVLFVNCLIEVQGAELSGESDDWTVKFVEVRACVGCQLVREFHFVVASKNDSRNYEMSFGSNVIDDISSIAIVDSNAAIISRLGTSQVVVIYDLEQNLKLNEFNTANLKVSPNGRYLLYRQYFPRTIEGGTTIFLLDLQDTGLSDFGKQLFPQATQSASSQNGEFPPGFVNVVWDTNRSRVLFTAVDADSKIKLVIAGIFESTDICFIPLIHNSRTSQHRNAVRKIEITSESDVQVILYEVGGVETKISIRTDRACGVGL